MSKTVTYAMSPSYSLFCLLFRSFIFSRIGYRSMPEKQSAVARLPVPVPGSVWIPVA
ncbi:MAG: hypothetical protein LIP08_09615 [Bacteroides sp.]|nr:hypothetical protein [Bacteroides sp.]